MTDQKLPERALMARVWELVAGHLEENRTHDMRLAGKIEGAILAGTTRQDRVTIRLTEVENRRVDEIIETLWRNEEAER